jgi:hypothetical protein
LGHEIFERNPQIRDFISVNSTTDEVACGLTVSCDKLHETEIRVTNVEKVIELSDVNAVVQVNDQSTAGLVSSKMTSDDEPAEREDETMMSVVLVQLQPTSTFNRGTK